MTEMEFGELAVFISDEISVITGSLNSKYRENGRYAASHIKYLLLDELQDFFQDSDGKEHDKTCKTVEMEFEDLSAFISNEIKEIAGKFNDACLDDGEFAAYCIRCTLVDRLRFFYAECENKQECTECTGAPARAAHDGTSPSSGVVRS